MGVRRKGRITVQHQPTGAARAARRMMGAVQAIFGFVFVCTAIGVIMPMSFLFGLPFLAMGGFAMAMGLINLFSKNGLAHQVGYDMESGLEEETIVGIMEDAKQNGPPFPAPESQDHIQSTALDAQGRLEQLKTLREAGLITQQEYDQKRREIVEEL